MFSPKKLGASHYSAAGRSTPGFSNKTNNMNMNCSGNRPRDSAAAMMRAKVHSASSGNKLKRRGKEENQATGRCQQERCKQLS